MLLNKELTTEKIFKSGKIIPCTKLPISNIIFPKWDDNGLFGMMIRQCVATKEFPEGHIYDEAQFQLVLRILDGKVLMSNRPDCYCWTIEKVKNQNAKGNVHPIGVNSANGLLNLSEVLQTVSDEKERKLLADMFVSWNKDLMLIYLPEEKRECILVTKEMIDAGISHIVNSYEKTDDNGDAPATPIFEGDLLIVEEPFVYRVGREEAAITYKF